MPVIRQKTDDEDMIWPPDGFTREWIVEWPNGVVKFRSLYLGGKEEGDYYCYWSNGRPAQIGCSSDGVCVGVWTDFLEDGTKLKETHYINNGTFKVLWFGVGGSATDTEYIVDHQKGSKEQFEHLAKETEPGAAPSGGPATPVGNSGATERPPSVS
jgi:hypothetical protein